MRRAIPALLLLLLARDASALDPEKQPSQYSYESWSMEDGLPAEAVTSVEPDEHGFLWYGTDLGGGWFDGVRFVPYPLENEAAVDAPGDRTMLPRADGTACIARNPGGLWCPGGPPIDHDWGYTHQAARDSRGRFWLAGDKALLRFEDGRLARIADGRFPSVTPTDDGGAWAGLVGKLVRVHPDGTLEEFPLDTPTSRPWGFAVGRDAVWIGSEFRLAVFRDGRVKPVDLPDDVMRAIAGHVIALHADRDGNLWIGTKLGLVRFRDGAVSRFPDRHPLRHVRVNDIAEDRDGSVWVATESGLHRLRDTTFTPIGAYEGLHDDEVLALVANGTAVDIGTGTGLQRYDGELREVPGFPKELANDFVPDLALEPGTGATWVALAASDKLVRVHEGRSQIVDLLPTTDPAHWPSPVFRIAFDEHGDLFGDGGGPTRLIQFRGGKIEKITKGGVPDDFDLHQLGDSIAVTSKDAFGMVVDGEIRMTVPHADGGTERIHAVLEDDEGRVWVAGAGGVSVVEGDTLRHLPGLPRDRVRSLVRDDGGMVWAGTDAGIYRFDPRVALAGDRPVPVRWFGPSDGLRSVTVCESVRTSDGRLWFATRGGAAFVDPARILQASSTPSVRLIGLRVWGRLEDSRGLAAGTRRFEIDYAASVLPAPGKARFKYRLDGFDPEWVDAGNRRTAFYTNVGAGEYRFRVMTAGGDGPWSEEAILEIRVAPFFWETRAFLVACGIALLGLIGGGVRLRTGRLRARARELEREVEAATSLLAARMDEKLARTGQVARFGEFAASVAHNLKTPLTFLRGEIELLEEKRRSGKMSDAELETALRAQLEHVRRMSQEIETGMSFVRPGAAPVVDVDLASLAREIALLLRARASASSIRIEIAVDGEPHVRGNLDNLRHAVANLVANAIDAMSAGGTVTISCRADGEIVEIRVGDTGPGIPEAVRAKLFRPFVSTKGEQGTGLGLASCRRIIEEEHGGEIRLEPSSSGATFLMRLPVAR